jgi:Na+/proline symporter
MISVGALSLCTLLYIALLFVTAVYADRRREMGRSITSNAWTYALSFGIFHTSWTFYGNVGRVATVGIDFIAFYLGATLIIFSWWYLLRKMVRISKEQNIVSIADFIASRYGKSLPLGALVTLFAVFCTLPYIALQLKGVADTFELLSASRPTLLPLFDTAFVVAIVFALFGILFGARHLDPSARHEGLVAAIALESVVKLVAMMAVGLFVTYGLFDGFGDIFSRFLERFPERSDLLLLGTDRVPYSNWLTLGVISMMAFMFLPHMFHIMVVENADEEHIRSAMWRFPLYMFLIELFIIPIALGGLLLHGGDTAKAEYFTLLLPLEAEQSLLSLLVFLVPRAARALREQRVRPEHLARQARREQQGQRARPVPLAERELQGPQEAELERPVIRVYRRKSELAAIRTDSGPMPTPSKMDSTRRLFLPTHAHDSNSG